ncbi:MAG: hypothetical protein R2939_10235 [Kofleriaceae bacterium]
MPRALLAPTAVVLLACGGGDPGQLPVTPVPMSTSPADVSDATPTPPRPWPATRREAIVDTLHGVAVADPYRWLEDERAPEVQAWMTAQDAYARAELAKLLGRDAWRGCARSSRFSISAPEHRGGGRYF